MNAYLWLKLVHVLAAITAVGTNLTYFVWLAGVRRSNEHSAYVLNGIRRLDARVANPAYVVLPLTGILMVLDADLGFTTFWIAAGIVLYVTMAAFAGIFFSPSLRRQVALAEVGPIDKGCIRTGRKAHNSYRHHHGGNHRNDRLHDGDEADRMSARLAAGRETQGSQGARRTLRPTLLAGTVELR